MTIEPPAMTPDEIAAFPSFAPLVRVSCYRHGCTLYVGDVPPEGGAFAVAAAAGCPDWSSTDLEVFDGCPVPDLIAAYDSPPVTLAGSGEATSGVVKHLGPIGFDASIDPVVP